MRLSLDKYPERLRCRREEVGNPKRESESITRVTFGPGVICLGRAYVFGFTFLNSFNIFIWHPGVNLKAQVAL